MGQLRTNERIELARKFLETTGENIFLTGKAGTGKTTFLRDIVKHIHKRLVVVAPTGVAALNAGGVTMHSFFQLPFSPHLPNNNQPAQPSKERAYHKIGKSKLAIIRSLELVVIDEISMVRSDMLDAVDSTLRRIRRDSRPFGGVQLLMIGDIQQLSPICHEQEWELLREYYDSPFFFDSLSLKKCGYVTVELSEIFRQSDSHFTGLLNAVRENNISQSIIEELNRRYVSNFNPSKEEGYITLTTHNHSANAINNRKLAELKAATHTFQAIIRGDYPEMAYPNDVDLEIKEGAQVMFIKNDPSPEKLFYNGMVGEVLSIGKDSVTVAPRTGSVPIVVKTMDWESVEYVLDSATGEIKENVKGMFSQIPLKCAWAITIHKSQGLTFDKAIIDAESSFAHGQVYVALSRCRSLEGLVLSSPLSMSSIVRDVKVDSFHKYVEANQPTESQLELYQRRYFMQQLCDVFEFQRLNNTLLAISKLLYSSLYRKYPAICDSMRGYENIVSEIIKVGNSFQKQISQCVMSVANYREDDYLAERLRKASEYFLLKMEPFDMLQQDLKSITPEAKDVRSRFQAFRQELNDMLAVNKCAMSLCDSGFVLEEYLRQKFEILTRDARGVKVSKPKKTKDKELKEEKKNTFDITLEHYFMGLDVSQIAAQRGLSEQTITNHLARFVASGDIDLEDFVAPDLIVEIEDAIAKCQDKGLKAVKEMLGDRVSYVDIKFVMSKQK